MRLNLYRSLSVLLLFDLVAIVYCLTVANEKGAYLSIGLLLTILCLQVFMIRCHRCSCRPGLWVLAIWTLLLDFELYIADTLFLRTCPKCQYDLHGQTLEKRAAATVADGFTGSDQCKKRQRN